MVAIRRSRPSDGVRVVTIWRDAVDATHGFLSSADRAAIEQEVQAFLPGAALWLAVDEDDCPLGFMLLDDAHVEALFIDPVHRGAGVGRALISHALSLHPNSLTTDVNEQNSQALGFYEHIGFKKVGRSAVDGQGRPYPLLHLSLASSSR